MRLPRTVQPIQRNTAAGAAAQPPGIQPAQVTPSGCSCKMEPGTIYYRPTRNSCNIGYLPQCTTDGGCKCVPGIHQKNVEGFDGGAVNKPLFTQLMQDWSLEL